MDRVFGECLWVRIWNLPMHGWCWSVILKVLKSVGELVSLSQEFKTNRRFVSALVRQRMGMTLPIELELSLGMRKYMVLLTEDRGNQSKYLPELGRFILPDRSADGDIGLPSRWAIHEINPVEKGKRPAVLPILKEPEGLVECSLNPGDAAGSDQTEEEAGPALNKKVSRSSMLGDANMRLEMEGRPTLVERTSHVGRSGDAM